jgi:transposase InsO family protein
VVTPGQARVVSDHLQERFGASQRRACEVLDRARSTVRYEAKPRDGEAELVREIERLAGRFPCYGYKRIWAKLRSGGWQVNKKRVQRLWRDLGLKRPFRPEKRKHRGVLPGSRVNSCAARPSRHKNDVWAWDFVFDRTADGRVLKWFTLVDEYTRECLILHADRTLSGADVEGVLARVVARRGAPAAIRSDNGPEFISQTIRAWFAKEGVSTLYIKPGSPWQNGYAEAFHSRLRDEFTEREEFESVPDARTKGESWRREYNTKRPHSGLAYRTPAEFAKSCDDHQTAA